MDPGNVAKVLSKLLQRFDESDASEFGPELSDHWPDGALSTLMGAGILRRVGLSARVVCDGCHQRCLITPERRSGPRGATLEHLCSDQGLIHLDPARAERISLDAAGIATWLARQLSLRGVPAARRDRLWSLGSRKTGTTETEIYFAWGLARADALRLDDLAGERFLVLVPWLPPSIRLHDGAPGRLGTIDDFLDRTSDGLRLDTDLLERTLIRPTVKHRAEPVLVVPEGTSWRNVVMRLQDDETLVIRVGRDVPVRITFSDLGMAKAGAGTRVPSQVWKTLMEFARAGGQLQAGQPREYDVSTKDVSRLGKELRAAFGIDQPPISQYHPAHGWKTEFLISAAEPEGGRL